MTKRFHGRVDRQALLRALAPVRRPRPAGSGHIFVVHSAKGGAGSSCLAANLAAALTAHAGPVALVDLNLAGADQDLLWNLSCPLGLTDVLGPEGHEVADAMVPHACGVWILAGPGGPAEAEEVSPQTIRPLLQSLAERHPYVVVDTADRLDEVTVAALEAASRVLCPLEPQLGALRRTQRMLSLVERLGLDQTKFDICLWERTSDLDGGSIKKVIGKEPLWRLPWQPQPMQEAVNAGRPLYLSAPKNGFSRSVSRLASMLAGAPCASSSATSLGQLLAGMATWLRPKRLALSSGRTRAPEGISGRLKTKRA